MFSGVSVSLSSLATDTNGFDREVKEFMTREVITINSEEDIRTAASRMMIFGIGGLVVDNKETQANIALITERDLIRRLAQRKSLDFLMRSIQYEIEAESKLSKAAFSPI